MSFPTHTHKVFDRIQILIFCLLGLGVLENGFTQTLSSRISNDLQSVAADERVDILISFGPEIDWDQLQVPALKDEKGLYVYQMLRDRADHTQNAVRAFLEAHAIPYATYSIVNAIHTELPGQYLDALARLEGVSKISRNSPFEQEYSFIDETPVVTRSAEPEWGIVHIRADSVWALGYKGQGVIVGGEDTGFDWDHPALKASYRGTQGDTAEHAYNWHDAIHEINPLNGDTIIDPSNNPCGLDSPIPCDDSGHGTHTMGTMVGEEGTNQIGVAPGAKWIACRNMERGWGSPATYLECMEWFLAPTDENGENPDPLKSPHVINNSWTCPEIEGCNPDNFELLRQAVVNLRAAGIVVVVSAGNSGSGCGSVSTPLAIFEESFTVGAINASDTIAGFSSRGPVEVDSSFRLKPNVCAPGVQVRSAWLGDIYINANGTSMAGPHVAGVVALMISANPLLAGQVELIETIIEETARPKMTEQECGGINGGEVINNTYGYGVIDALAAVEAALLVSSTKDVTSETQNPFTVFPNPVSDRLFITSDAVHSASFLRIISAEGHEIYQAHDLALPAQLDVQKYPQGLYFIQLDNHTPVMIHLINE